MSYPIFILHYKGPVEVGGLALASDIIGLDGLAVTMGDKPKVRRTHKDATIIRGSKRLHTHQSKTKNLKLGCLLNRKTLN